MGECASECVEQHAVFPAGVYDGQVDITTHVIIQRYKKTDERRKPEGSRSSGCRGSCSMRAGAASPIAETT